MRNRSDNFRFVGLRCRGGYNGSFGFPLWGKLSPQVTDEGQLPDISPSSGACRATFPPRGRLSRRPYILQQTKKDAFASFFALYQLYKIIPRPLFRERSCAPPPTKFCGPRCFAHQNGCRRFPPTAWCRPRGWWAGSSKSYLPRCRSRGPRAG